jgi:S1-C subfamily serine protease
VALLVGGFGCQSSQKTTEKIPADDLKAQVQQLTGEVEQLKQELAAPSLVLNRYRNSIGYIYGVYRVGFGSDRPLIRTRISGTGFLVGDGLIATNRHVAQPWYGDPDAKRLIDRGATPTLEDLVVFFPNSPKALKLLPGAVSNTSDLAVLRTVHSDVIRDLPALPLAASAGPAGQMVVVIGYPLGTQGMVAKSPSDVYERLAYKHNDIDTVSKLAEMSLIRPSTTYGHLGDIVGDKIVYDASSAHGGSGGPVLNSKGEVIGVNFAYMDGFSGSTLGISVDSLRPLLQEVSATAHRN